jgi:Tfp pilus assembly protein PilE
MKNIRQLWTARRGYTIDQTILIVAIIAILITLVIVTIGWTLLGRAGGNKVGSQLTQIQPAVAQFYNINRTYPSTMASLSTAGLLNLGNTVSGTLAQSGNFIIVTFNNVNAVEASTADLAIDGGTTADGSAGSVKYAATGDCTDGATTDGMVAGTATYPNSGQVRLCYQVQRVI